MAPCGALHRGAMKDSKKAARAWTAQQTKAGRRDALPAIAYGLAGSIAAAGQACCAAVVLAAAIKGQAGGALLSLAGFAALIALRAVLTYLAERASFAAGAAGRNRLRADVLARLLAAGPALLRGAHSSELAACVVDRERENIARPANAMARAPRTNRADRKERLRKRGMTNPRGNNMVW